MAERRERLQLLLGCTAAAADSVAARAVMRRWPARRALIRQGDACTETFLLAEGRARVTLVTLDGRQVRLHDHLPGDLFGAIDATGAAVQPADVVSAEAVEAAIFRGADFILLVETHACLGLALSRSLVRRLGAVTDRLLERSTLSVPGRVNAELLRLARAGDGRTIRPSPVLSELAQRVGSSRETVSRAVSLLERRGLVSRDTDAMVIVAPHRLEELIY